ncbi:MAG: hypothetical protein LBV41_12960 [Cytophagaceae bacterium]|jgi:hypothetical protein|nr:hypothetical protein [Cytophagaceae bacterium]
MFRLLKISILFALFLWLTGCERDYSFRGGADGLNFSTDTVTFDTVFTTIGSATYRLMAYNPYNDDMTIDAIRLAGGESSKFRININGFPETSVREIPVIANDSLLILIEVTINPADNHNSFFADDSILFYTKERIQSVRLEAYVQDVVVLRSHTFANDTVLKNEKPYLVFDYLVVDSLKTLTIDKGVHIHFYEGASMQVFGTLKVNGTKDEPVLFAGHRLEKFYNDRAGQWGGIHLRPGSREHAIDYATIRNSYYGLNIDSVGVKDQTPVELRNTQINYITKQGLLAQTAAINVENCVFGYCGSSSVALTVGGKYNFYHSTIANYNMNTGVARDGFDALVVSNYYPDKNNEPVISDLDFFFYNCIISGNRNENDISIDIKKTELCSVNWRFSHSLLKTSATNDSLTGKHFDNIKIEESKDNIFMDDASADFRLDTLSVAKDIGNLNIVLANERLLNDIAGNSRTKDNAPDAGAYERGE